MKKILIVSYARVIGGGEIYLASLLPRIKDRFSITVLGAHKLRALLSGSGDFKSFRLPPQWLDKLPRNYRLRKYYYRLYFKINGLRDYDLISLQDFDGALIEAINRRPLALTIQTRFLIPREFDETVRARFAKIDKVICVSEQTKRDLLERGIQADKCVVIHNAVDPAKYQFNQEAGAYVTWVGRVEAADKNPTLFVKIAALAKEQGLDYKFRVVGDGSYLPDLKDQAAVLDNIEFTGFCPPEDMPRIYKDASILCMTSTSEGIPFVALEAMASGVPVVATNVGGLPEIISSKAVGALTEVNEHKLLAAIDDLLKDPKQYRSVAKAARKRIESDFSLESMAAKTSAVYESLLR